MACTVTFWGTRGSIPTPGPHTARYGGNTPCVAVAGADGELLVLDAGTGIRALGVQLVEQKNGSVQAEILLSHAHWDHIQGLPHFKPFFAPGNTVRIWGARQGTTSLEAILRQQMDPAVFPVPLDALSARLTVQHIEPGEFTVGAFRVRAIKLRHPGTTLGYRLTPSAGGPSLAYVTDNELGSGGHYDIPAPWRRHLVAFLADADPLLHDAMRARAAPRMGPLDLRRSGGAGCGCGGEAAGVVSPRAGAWRRRDGRPARRRAPPNQAA
ncbi:MAG: hypothetical protein DMD36_06745 [Gemmatimonadetes bacterium]|nr:MAG: hypothetical protein DMD36_06745 [Gemmatimonadota bacterium]